ncbi:prolipoprotein diacylglyceryl transferase [Bacteroidota bacterium]
MHPVLFEFNTPEFLRFILPDTITIYFYGFMIASGAILGMLYTQYEGKKRLDISSETIQQLVFYIILSAIIGGKLFIVFEDPERYTRNLSSLITNFNQGFVFYGSLLFAIPVMLIFFKWKKIPVLPMLDIIAVTAVIVHSCGRIGCFMAGCCHGIPTTHFWGVTFTNPVCQADPLHTPLHPTQLYSFLLLVMILAILLRLNKIKKFDGQVFLTYLMLYAIGRSVIEIFRGDLSRGFVIEGILSNSQFISLLIIIVVLIIYIRMYRKGKLRRYPKK